MTRNNIHHGYAYVYSIFNGFGELERRDDVGRALLELYADIN